MTATEIIIPFSYAEKTHVDDMLIKYKNYHNNHTIINSHSPIIICKPLMRGGMNNRIYNVAGALTIAFLKWKLFYCMC